MSDSEGIEPNEQEKRSEEKESKTVMPKGTIIDRDVDLSQSPAGVFQAELSAAQAEARDNYDKYLRALAELENFKKRALKERSELVKYQGERIFADIIDVVDDLERALQHVESDPSQLKTGLEMIHKRFTDVLSRWDVRGESAVGKHFDPNLHHALSKVTTPDAEPGTIVGELKKPYFYKDKVLRHGEVVVAEEPAGGQGQNGEEK